MKIVYRQTQEIHYDMWMKELELEHTTDVEEARLGHPLPRRYRMFSGNERTQTRVHMRTYDSFEDWGKMFEAWAEDEIGQQLEVERHNFYLWEREELLLQDDPIDVKALQAELDAMKK
ncbi:MAG: hypothetical protein FWF81_01870 [Defluviitaleaceae bacterium]|nr:hypothetical protein [Defluviitaleaceae bacterium]